MWDTINLEGLLWFCREFLSRTERLLSRTQALGRDQMLTIDCEFYGRRFAYGVVCPALQAEAVRFTGASG